MPHCIDGLVCIWFEKYKMTQSLLFSSVFLVHFIRLSTSCQDAWVLKANDLEYGNTISFKNTTIVGKQESLSWIWSGKNSENWKNEIFRSLQNGSMHGSLIYRTTKHGKKTQVSLSWQLNGKDFQWENSDKEVFHSHWSLSLCYGVNMKFSSNKDGSWIFKIDDFVIRKGSSNQTNGFAGGQTIISRKRRSEKEGLPDDQTETNVTTTEPGVFDCVYNFFFGEGDPATGRSEGVFTKMKNWMKRMACHLTGGCDDSEPGDTPSYTPTVTLPPFNPDAEPFEEVPGSFNNDV